jgi:hypothetical protein
MGREVKQTLSLRRLAIIQSQSFRSVTQTNSLRYKIQSTFPRTNSPTKQTPAITITAMTYHVTSLLLHAGHRVLAQLARLPHVGHLIRLSPVRI